MSFGQYQKPNCSFLDTLQDGKEAALEKFIFQGKIESTRKPGRPRTLWMDRIKSLVGQNSFISV